MQLHVCLLLFIITTDKTLALSHHHCGGKISFDQEPAGHINLTLPGLFTDPNRLNPTNHPSDKTLPASVCTWMLDIPLGRTVLLKLIWLESGSNISVRCVWNEEKQLLASGGTALLSDCDTNKATISWTGAGYSSNVIQVSYYVQEDKKNSSEDHTSPHSDQNLLRWSQTGSSFMSPAPVGQEVVRGTEGGRGRLFEGREWNSAPPSASSTSSQDQGLLHRTSPLQGLTVAGRADRETHPLPEEEPNNRADTSVAAHLTDGPMSARERTHPYFQPTRSTDTLFHTSHTTNTETNSYKTQTLPQTQMAVIHASASTSNTLHGTEIHKQTNTATTQAPLTVSSSSIPPLTSSPPEPPLTSSPPEPHSWTPWVRRAVSGAPGEKLPHSWRSQRSTDRLDSDLTSTVTSDPLKSPTEPHQDNSSWPQQYSVIHHPHHRARHCC
ncbi:uncharacterized protein LOC119898897 [Micropterus salmoides]|uniref:uncharacterized protein LOC119898897 n=1 Tax=Micropterus salmoides TaxID=27706 RepID=UPI0018EAD027|nr:uncharacterized protein LOC119898897 [Micropterus salmoides]